MKIARLFPVLAALAAAASFSSDPRAALSTSADLQKASEDFYKLDLDGAKAYDVTSATIVRDIGVVRLTKGVLLFSQPIEGVTPIAVFMGEGSFSVTPVRKMDKDMLTIAGKEHLKKDLGGMVNTKLTEAFLIAYDKAWDDIKASLSDPRAATPAELSRAKDIVKDRLAVLDNTASRPEMALISRAASDYKEDEVSFRAEVNTTDHGWLAFGFSPNATYEVGLVSREPIGAYYQTHPLIVTHKKADLDSNGRYIADPVADLHEKIKVKRYLMDLEIPDLQQLKINLDMTFESKEDGLIGVTFDLINDLVGPRWNSRAKWVDVTSVKDSAGNDLAFLHRKNRLLVRFKEPMKKGQEAVLKFGLTENTIIQLSNVHWLMLNTYPWFPQYGYLGGQYQIDWTVKTVKPLTATGSGKTVRTWEEAKLNGAEMTFDRAVQFPSIIFGRYQAETGEYDSKAGAKVALAVHSWPKTIFSITDSATCDLLNVPCPLNIEVDVPSSKPKDVIEEGKSIIKFMEELYGPFPYDKLDVAMMAPGLGFGQAPPAFVQLTGEAFMSSSLLTSDFFHEFYSHEIAHQWWGHKIGWISDEDTWLSESYAEYSAGLYVLGLQGVKRFQEKMKRWKDNAVIGDPHGSIAWCNNLSGPNAGLYRTGLIYNKGPYVVHMLRMMMGIDNFKKAMQSVFAKYGYTNITTDAVQRECEAVAGYKLDFFFDQWFRGTGIPKFDYSWTSEPTADGKFLVTIKISQRDKENFKIVQMPVFMYFKGQKEPRIIPRPILKADDVYQVKLPQKPEKIVLDEDHDILGDMIPSGAGAGQ